MAGMVWRSQLADSVFWLWRKVKMVLHFQNKDRDGLYLRYRSFANEFEIKRMREMRDTSSRSEMCFNGVFEQFLVCECLREFQGLSTRVLACK